jgi:hypothetical protein
MTNWSAVKLAKNYANSFGNEKFLIPEVAVCNNARQSSK